MDRSLIAPVVLQEAVEYKREATRDHRIGAIHHLEVDMGLRRVPRVATFAESVTDVDHISGGDGQRATFEVDEGDVLAVGEAYNDVVTSETGGALFQPTDLAEGIGEQRQLGTARLVVRFPVVYVNHGPIGRSENGLSEPNESLGWLGSQPGTPIPASAAATALVYRHQVDRVSAGHGVGAVTRNASRRAVLNEARSGQRERQDGWLGHALKTVGGPVTNACPALNRGRQTSLSGAPNPGFAVFGLEVLGPPLS